MHAFVDESKRSDTYLLAAAGIEQTELNVIRAMLRTLCRPGQRRLHFVKEGNPRRRQILSALVAADLRARVYSCTGPPLAAREACLLALVSDLVPAGAERLVLESRETMDHLDLRVINSALRKHGEHRLDYLHLRPEQEPLLWIADAVAWSVGAGGDWRRRVAPLVEEHTQLRP